MLKTVFQVWMLPVLLLTVSLAAQNYKPHVEKIESELEAWNVPGARAALAEMKTEVKDLPAEVENFYQGRVSFEEGRYAEAVRFYEDAKSQDKPNSYLRLAKDTLRVVENHERIESEHFVFYYPKGKDSVLVPYAPGVARIVLFAGLALHLALALAVIRALAGLPTEGRGVNPVWHLTFVGFIIGGLAAVPLGHEALARGILWAMLPVAVVIWGISLVQLASRVPPAPLRPLLAIHIAPAALFSTVAGLTGQDTLALIFAGLGLAMLLALLAAGSWIAASGFSALWGAFTFPLVALASALLARDGLFVWTGIGALIVALGFVPWVLWQVLKLWPGGKLAARTNAAEA